jgi:hypothetical protein
MLVKNRAGARLLNVLSQAIGMSLLGGAGECLLTVLSYTQAGILTTEFPTKDSTLNLPLSCPTKHETPACV